MDNLEIWNALCETDPRHTKKVNYGRGFTAIDPMWQIYNATRHFGPAGKAWGWSVQRVDYLPTNHLTVLIRLWHGNKEQFIEHAGQCSMYVDKAQSKPDEDCFKKAITDGVTKCLSQLGCNADVFLGKFDDNKYVQDMAQKYTDNDAKQTTKEIADKIHECNTLEDLEDLRIKARASVALFDKKYQTLLAAKFKLRESSLKGE